MIELSRLSKYVNEGNGGEAGAKIMHLTPLIPNSLPFEDPRDVIFVCHGPSQDTIFHYGGVPKDLGKCLLGGRDIARVVLFGPPGRRRAPPRQAHPQANEDAQGLRPRNPYGRHLVALMLGGAGPLSLGTALSGATTSTDAADDCRGKRCYSGSRIQDHQQPCGDPSL